MDKEQKALYEYLIEYATDEETAKIIISGGVMGYYYGMGGYIVLDKEALEDASKDENNLIIDDASLPNKYLVGSLA